MYAITRLKAGLTINVQASNAAACLETDLPCNMYCLVQRIQMAKVTGSVVVILG